MRTEMKVGNTPQGSVDNTTQGSVDGPFLTARELAELLRIKERKVYDLAAKGQVPVSRATGKLLFPRAEVEAWIASNSAASGQGQRPGVFLGSFDPLLEWALRESQCGLATLFDGSRDGLRRFMDQGGVAAGLHLHEAQGWNTRTLARDCAGTPAVLIHFAQRARGLVARRDFSAPPRKMADLRGLRCVPRRAGAGSQLLFDELLADAGVAKDSLTYTAPAASEADAVQVIAQGAADVTFGLQALGDLYALPFAPIVSERFDLLIDRRAYFEPPMQTFLAFCRTDQFARHAAGLPGYDVSGLGLVMWNG